jgi:hypothetical protein
MVGQISNHTGRNRAIKAAYRSPESREQGIDIAII